MWQHVTVLVFRMIKEYGFDGRYGSTATVLESMVTLSTIYVNCVIHVLLTRFAVQFAIFELNKILITVHITKYVKFIIQLTLSF